MLYFPQLSTGAMAQYPLSKRLIERTVLNRAADGSEVKLADPGGSLAEWEMHFSGLAADELGKYEELFLACEGRLRGFTFLDPMDNLLGRSEDLVNGAWEKDGLIQLTPDMAGPLGRPGATQVINAGQIEQRLWQNLGVPAWYHYCLSVYARSAEPGQIGLFTASDSTSASQIFATGPEWQRLMFAVNLRGTEEAVRFGMEIPAGGVAEVFGFQTEAQTGASRYKRTPGKGGLYRSARFQDDSLAVRADGTDSHSLTVRVSARIEDQ